MSSSSFRTSAPWLASVASWVRPKVKAGRSSTTRWYLMPEIWTGWAWPRSEP